ncbi:hypothetical protein QO206_13280 [Leeuwenhoekiella aequorea]|uniref:hypothetical protein n=1 Tax=Leeuwenhoekiella aequorea TaxID=283736 RepID=UPI00352CA486|tara:strand:+ start:18233 stop:19525 length:1293 start_codon:yes stop_codon:yes gene_type:complete
MTQEEANAKAAAFEKSLNDANAAISKAATKEEVEAVQKSITGLKEEFSGFAKSEKMVELENLVKEQAESLKEQGEALTSIKMGGKNFENNFYQKVNTFVKDNFEKIKSLKSQGHGLVEMEVKAVGDITTGSATNPDGIPELVGIQQAGASNVNLRGTFVESLTNNVNTSLAAYPYTETLPKDGDFAFVAEGTAKPQIDFKIETRYANPVKIAAWVRLTDESVQDIPGLQSIARDYLRKKHDIKKQQGLLFGDGIAPNPKGATLYGRTFVAGDMATSVTNPNMMDIINAAATDVHVTHNYEDEMQYMPSLVVLNPVDFFLQFVSAKDGEGKPLYPTASLYNTVNIGGMTIIPDRVIPAGKIFVADMSKYNTTNYVGYTVKIGWINDDFIKNQFVMLAESRFHAFVKKLDEQAFIYDDIATIKDAIDAANAA